MSQCEEYVQREIGLNIKNSDKQNMNSIKSTAG